MAYITPENLTDLGLVLQYVNNVSTNYYLGIGLLVAIYSILFLNLKMKGELTEDCLIVAGWVTSISSVFFLLLGIIQTKELYISVILMVVPMVWAYGNKE